MAGPSPQTEQAAERQPTNFDSLDTKVTAVDDVTVTRVIACRCGARTGRLMAGGTSQEVLWLDPLAWICGACGTSHDFFNSNRDGYDGRFGHGSSYEQGFEPREIACPSCGGAELSVRCVLFYNVDPSEIEEDLEPERSRNLSDYFDALEVNAGCASCQREFEVGIWELA